MSLIFLGGKIDLIVPWQEADVENLQQRDYSSLKVVWCFILKLLMLLYELKKKKNSIRLMKLI